MKELRLLGRSEPGAYYAARATKTGGNVSAVMFPPRIGDLLDPDALYGYALLGKDVRLVCEVVIMPPLVSALGGRSWLEEYAPSPRPKGLAAKVSHYLARRCALGIAYHEASRRHGCNRFRGGLNRLDGRPES